MRLTDQQREFIERALDAALIDLRPEDDSGGTRTLLAARWPSSGRYRRASGA